jgi:histidinol dehydrogenase
MSVRRFDASAPGFADAFGKFLSLRRAQGTEDVHAKTAVIVRDVRERGGEAVADYTRRFDAVTLDPQMLQANGIDLFEAAERCRPDVREALNFAAERIEAYHAHQKPQDHLYTDPAGLELGWRWTPVDAVGLYVPGGRASYPSSVLMNAIPAKAAGVKRIAMVSPVPGGDMNPAVAYAAVRAGVTEFYPIGGAQAVAALAYGAGGLKPVDKIVGPGNAYVAAAKRIVFGDVGIDTIAGPSEITVVADNQNRPEWIAADLLSQAEHDPLAQSILITEDAEWASKVEAALERQMAELATGGTVAQAWADHGAIVIAPLGSTAPIVNQIAPEHVELAVADPDAIARDVRHSGAIFLGRYAPEALGDYVTGSNHVLPTSGAARFASGLSVLDFMKRTSI